MFDFRVISTLQVPNMARFYKYMFASLERMWKEATRVFIATAVMNMSIDTGMSVGSFAPLAARVRLRSRITELLRGFGPSKPGHKNIKSPRFSDNMAKRKSRTLGERLGKKAYEISFGTYSNPVFNFDFKIVVFQHYLHESFENFSMSENWSSLEKGREAMLNFIETHAVDYMPDIAHWLLTGEIVTNG